MYKINLLQHSILRRWSLWYFYHGIHTSIFKDCHLLLTQEGRKRWVYVAARSFLVRQLTFLAVQMMKYSEETDCTETVQNIHNWRQWRTRCTGPTGLVGLGLLWAWRSLVVLAQAPAGSCWGGKRGLRTSMDIWALLGALLKGAYVRKTRFFYDFLLKLRLCKGHCSCSAGMFTYHKDSHCHWFSSFKCDNYSEFRLVGAVSFYVQ